MVSTTRRRLRRADIGVAMGITGTDVAKEASAMVLLDDNFATIVRAIREGRRIYDNIRRFIRYAVTTNSGEIWIMFLAPFMGLPVPLLPIQILWINLVTDGLPGLALAVEPEEPDIMRRPPRPPQESVFARGLGVHVLWVGPLMAALVLGTQAWSLATGSAHWQTHGLHHSVLRTARPRGGDPLGARVVVHPGAVVEPTAPGRGAANVPAAAGHHLRPVPQRHLQNGALEPDGIGLGVGDRLRRVLGGRGGEMAETPTLTRTDRWARRLPMLALAAVISP